MFDYLGSHHALKFQIGRHLLDAANKHFSAAGAGDLGDFPREFCSETAVKKCAGFVEEKTVTTTDLQKLATGKSAFAQIKQKSPKRCPEGRLLVGVTCVAVAGLATFIVRGLTINLLHRTGCQPRIEIMQSAHGATRDGVWVLQTERNVAFVAMTQRAGWIFQI